jgi:hypothetical protein
LSEGRRWCVLSIDQKAKPVYQLCTYESTEMTKATEEIPLVLCKGVKSAEDDTKKANSFVSSFQAEN